MKLLLLSQYFPPEMGAPQTRLLELGEELIDLGWDVRCLTALPNYPTGRIFTDYTPDRPATEMVSRIKTVRVPLRPAKAGFMRRLYCYFSFVHSVCRYGPQYCGMPDLMFVESPPLFIGFAAQKLGRYWKCPYVFNVSDLWPESAVRMGIIKKGLLSFLAEKLELYFYHHAIGVTGQSSEIIESIRRRARTVRTEVITNGVDPSRFGKRLLDKTALDLIEPEAGPVFIYAGLFGLAQGLDQILDLAKRLPSSIPGRFVLVGDGPTREHLQYRIANERIDRVKLIAAQPRNRIPALLAASDAAIITLGTGIPGAVPSKIYEAMASELPILLVATGEPERRVNEARAGICVAPGDMPGLMNAFERLATDNTLRKRTGIAGRQAAETLYNRTAIAARLDSFLRSSLPSRS